MVTNEQTGLPRLIAHMAGGLGNQMFIYAAARCLSMRHGLELVLDTKSGFAVDRRYKRTFQLHHLNLPKDLLERSFAYRPPNRWLLSLRRRIERQLPEDRRSWLFDTSGEAEQSWPRIRRTRTTRLEGYWQDERHFASCSDLIRKELSPPEPAAGKSVDALRMIRREDSVAIHLRLHDPPTSSVLRDDLSAYYRNAIAAARLHAPMARMYAFSDDAAKARTLLATMGIDAVFPETGTAAMDMLAMSSCRVLIMAPSTLSWWAAWLSRSRERVIFAPELLDGWGFTRLLRPDWVRIQPELETSGR